MWRFCQKKFSSLVDESDLTSMLEKKSEDSAKQSSVDAVPKGCYDGET